jgi:hypothetical protein
MDIEALFEVEARNMNVDGSADKLANCCVQAVNIIPPLC